MAVQLKSTGPAGRPIVSSNPAVLMKRMSTAAGSLPLRAGAISYLEYKGLRFIINDCPSEQNLADYIHSFKRYNVTDVVRVCHATYSIPKLNDCGIAVHDWPFEDGTTPPDAVITSWLALVKQRFGAASVPSASASPSSRASVDSGFFETQSQSSGSSMDAVDINKPPSAIAVHCVAGLGRAPVLVAIALIEYGMNKLDAIDFIRSKRRGAFNVRQIEFLDTYKKQSGKKLFPKLGNFFFRRSSAN